MKNKDSNLIWRDIAQKLENYKNEEMNKRFCGNYLEFDENLKDIKSSISKIKSEEKKLYVLNDVKMLIEEKMKDADSVIEILNAMRARITELKKGKISSTKFESSKTESYKDKSDKYYLTDKFKKTTKTTIEEIFDTLENCNLKTLMYIEETYHNKIKEKSSLFRNPQAFGKIIGSLNRGMFGATKQNVIAKLRKQGGKVAANTRLLEYMSPNLLKYRIIALRIINSYCNKIDKRESLKSQDGFPLITEEDYEEIRERSYFVGDVIKEIYSEKYGITPNEEIFSNIYRGQLTIEDIKKNR